MADDVTPIPAPIFEKAKRLVATMSAHPELDGFDIHQKALAHAIWVSTRVDESTKEFYYTLCVAIHPKFGGKIAPPKEFEGLPVEQHPWPTGN